MAPNKSMFRIQRSANGKVGVLTLSGRIKEADLTELQKLLECEAGDHSLTLDLKEVRLVDRDVIGFVAGCKARGVNIANCPAYIQKRVETEGHETANKCYHTIVGQNVKIFTPWLVAIRWRDLAS